MTKVVVDAPAGYGSAGGGTTASYRGVTLLVGGVPELVDAEGRPSPRAPTGEDYAAPQPLLIAALIAAVGAFATSLRGGRRRERWVAALAGAAAALATLAQLDVKRVWTARIVERLQAVQPLALEKADPSTFVVPGLGFWALIGLLGAAVAISLALAALDRAPTARSRVEEPAPLAS
jgi:hypothetical protein